MIVSVPDNCSFTFTLSIIYLLHIMYVINGFSAKSDKWITSRTDSNYNMFILFYHYHNPTI